LEVSRKRIGAACRCISLTPRLSEFEPSLRLVSSSWRRQPAHIRDTHFFAELDFSDGQAIYQRLGLSSAPTVQFHPSAAGPGKGNKLEVISYDVNRK
jgi:oligosaccharyltransferase complex subunit gamma